MKLYKIVKSLSLFLVISFLATTLATGQETTKKDERDSRKNPDGSYTSTKFDEADRPDDSYLAKFHARDIVAKLVKENLKQIYLLKIIVTNFSDKGWKGDFDKIYEGYKDSLQDYYQRNFIYSRVKLEKNRNDIYELQKKIIEDYKKETEEMLIQCADTILLLSLDAKTLSDPDKFDQLRLNERRLQIAYGQFDDSAAAKIDHYYDGSIFHLRVAKKYAIQILAELAKPADKDGILDKYKFHRADNRNRVYRKAGESATTTEKTTQ